jgi:hypothetical protein
MFGDVKARAHFGCFWGCKVVLNVLVEVKAIMPIIITDDVRIFCDGLRE